MNVSPEEYETIHQTIIGYRKALDRIATVQTFCEQRIGQALDPQQILDLLWITDRNEAHRNPLGGGDV